MPRSKELNSVCKDLLSYMRSRNFDVGGYWGMGVLYQEAFDKDNHPITSQIYLDLEHTNTNFNSVENQLAKGFLFSNINRLALLKRFAKDVEINVEFGIKSEKVNRPPEYRIGNPYKITAKIRRKDGRVFSQTAFGYCYRIYDCPFYLSKSTRCET